MVSAAAQALNMSQPAASRMIGEMEALWQEAKAQEDKRKAYEAALAKAAANAGDKEKLFAYATAIENASPVLKNQDLNRRLQVHRSQLIHFLQKEHDAL